MLRWPFLRQFVILLEMISRLWNWGICSTRRLMCVMRRRCIKKGDLDQAIELSDAVLDRLECADRLPKGLAGVRIVAREEQQGFRAADLFVGAGDGLAGENVSRRGQRVLALEEQVGGPVGKVQVGVAARGIVGGDRRACRVPVSNP